MAQEAGVTCGSDAPSSQRTVEAVEGEDGPPFAQTEGDQPVRM